MRCGKAEDAGADTSRITAKRTLPSATYVNRRGSVRFAYFTCRKSDYLWSTLYMCLMSSRTLLE